MALCSVTSDIIGEYSLISFDLARAYRCTGYHAPGCEDATYVYCCFCVGLFTYGGIFRLAPFYLVIVTRTMIVLWFAGLAYTSILKVLIRVELWLWLNYFSIGDGL